MATSLSANSYNRQAWENAVSKNDTTQREANNMFYLFEKFN
jgi:hypothetical protein